MPHRMRSLTGTTSRQPHYYQQKPFCAFVSEGKLLLKYEALCHAVVRDLAIVDDFLHSKYTCRLDGKTQNTQMLPTRAHHSVQRAVGMLRDSTGFTGEPYLTLSRILSLPPLPPPYHTKTHK